MRHRILGGAGLPESMTSGVDRALAGLPPGARVRAGDLTQPFSTGAILTVDGGTVLA